MTCWPPKSWIYTSGQRSAPLGGSRSGGAFCVEGFLQRVSEMGLDRIWVGVNNNWVTLAKGGCMGLRLCRADLTVGRDYLLTKERESDMKTLRRAALAAVLLCIPVPGYAQEVAPFFQQVPAILYETYTGVNQPAFNQYFESMVAKQERDAGTPWSIYSENAKVAYRVTVLPEMLASIQPIQQGRAASFQEFTEEQLKLYYSAWGTRHVAVYTSVPSVSYVPDDLTVDDVRGLPFHRTQIYHLKWDKQDAFWAALERRNELDREGGIDNLVLTVWNGGIGTETPVVMIRVSAESLEADQAGLAERMRIREAYWDELVEQNEIMNAAAVSIERHDQTRISELSSTRPR